MMRKEDRAFYASGCYALIPDIIMRKAVEAKLSATGTYVFSKMLAHVNNVGEMMPVPFESLVKHSNGIVTKSAFSRATRCLRNEQIIEPMMRRINGEDFPDSSNYKRVCSYRIVRKLWDTVEIENKLIDKVPIAHPDPHGVVRTGSIPPVYAKNTYTAVPYPVLLAACQDGCRPQAALTLMALMRNVDWFGRLDWSVDWISAIFGLKRVNILNSVERLIQAHILTPISFAKSSKELKINDKLWGKVPIDEEKYLKIQDETILEIIKNTPYVPPSKNE